jgi:hypothetical protein
MLSLSETNTALRRVFVNQPKATYAEVNLNALAERKYGKDRNRPNPLLDPQFCGAFVRQVASSLQVSFTYGGYLEDRRVIWRGHYHSVEAMQHLGVDYNVPSGTLVAAPQACQVVQAWHDPDQNGGWGGRVVVKLRKRYRSADYAIFAHLDPATYRERRLVRAPARADVERRGLSQGGPPPGER